LVGWFRRLEDGSQPSLNGPPRNLHTGFFGAEIKAETHFQTFFTPTPKNLAGKTSILRQLIEDRRQSEARNFETAQHNHKQITIFSSTINALQNSTELGAITPWGFDAT